MSDSLKFESSTPLYLQLEEKIRTDINCGALAAGSKLPTENELSENYHVSRVTVRKALALLEKNGYIDRKTGKGTYIAEAKLQRNLSGNVMSFTGMCRQMGMKASSRTLLSMHAMPSDTEREQLNLEPHDQMLVIERIRFADEQPVMIERDFFSENFSFLLDEDLDHSSLFELIRDKAGITFLHAARTIDIVFASASEARLLGLKTGYPLLRIVSITQDSSGKHTTMSTQLCIGDKFKLRV